jgi:group II intron reverse transcriptase/maturase
MNEAYKRVKSKGGVAGVDGITFKEIENRGIKEYLSEIKLELKERTYKPLPVKRVYIRKSNGKKRPLGIPTIKDRIVQTSCKMVIEPIFEAAFEESSYGYRPKRSAHDAIKAIRKHLESGKTNIYDADIESFFQNIPHDKILILIGTRISDKNVIHLIKMWLKAPIEENGRISGGKRNRKGTPQGGVISPLLANIYLHLLDKSVNRMKSTCEYYKVEMIRYCDDFVLMGKQIPKTVIEKIDNILKRMELRVNKEKTRTINAKKEALEFLGFTIRHDKDLHGRDRKYWNIIPSKESEKRVRKNIAEYLKRKGHLPPQKIVKGLNEIIRGWINYFNIAGISYSSKAKRNLRHYLLNRLDRYYNRKSQRRSRLYSHNAFGKLVSQYGLIDPTKMTCALTTSKT